MVEKCNHCLKSIVAIGHGRKNGKNHNEWNSRKYHKKCYIEVLKNIELQEYVLKLAERKSHTI
jgi:hypothetical protein